MTTDSVVRKDQAGLNNFGTCRFFHTAKQGTFRPFRSTCSLRVVSDRAPPLAERSERSGRLGMRSCPPSSSTGPKPQDFEFSPTTSPRPALSPQHPPPIGRQVTTASLEDVGSPAARRGGRGVDGSSDQRKAPEKNHRRERSEILHVHGSSVRFTDGRPKRCFSLAPLCNTLAPAG